MARAFDGSDDYLAVAAGGTSAIDGGPVTVAVIVKLASHDVGGVLTARPAAGGFTWALAVSGGDWYYGAGDIMNIFAASTADGWTLVAVTKAGGVATPRGHKYVYGTNTWTHANGAGTVSDAGAALGSDGTIEFGRWDNYSEYATADIAVGAVWDRVLTDAEVELLAHSLTSWSAAAPAGMWILDQSATTQTVADATGGGANQTAITGTAVSANSAPIGYGHEVLVPHSVPAGGVNPDLPLPLANSSFF